MQRRINVKTAMAHQALPQDSLAPLTISIRTHVSQEITVKQILSKFLTAVDPFKEPAKNYTMFLLVATVPVTRIHVLTIKMCVSKMGLLEFTHV